MTSQVHFLSYSSALVSPSVEEIHWLQRELPDPKDQREYAQERCIVAVTEALGEAMERAGVNRTQLAQALGVSKSHVSQLFAGRNLTLRTIGDVLWVCGLEVRDLELDKLGVAVVPLEHAAEWRMGFPPREASPLPDSEDASLYPATVYSPRREVAARTSTVSSGVEASAVGLPPLTEDPTCNRDMALAA